MTQTQTHATNITLARALVALRGERGISQHALAQRSGISRCTIARIEASEGTKVETIAALASGLDVSLAELFKHVEPMPEAADASDLETLTADLTDLAARAGKLVIVH